MAPKYQQKEGVFSWWQKVKQLLQASLAIWGQATVAPALPDPNLVLLYLLGSYCGFSWIYTLQRAPCSHNIPSCQCPQQPDNLHRADWDAKLPLCECFGPIAVVQELGWDADNAHAPSAGSGPRLQEEKKLEIWLLGLSKTY